VNSSKTWKSGERCQVAGTYRCQQCRLEERETLREMAGGAVLPLCDACPGKDATWRLVRESGGAAPK
jgi:hypothetical protein